jgi:hypothetical protein
MWSLQQLYNYPVDVLLETEAIDIEMFTIHHSSATEGYIKGKETKIHGNL